MKSIISVIVGAIVLYLVFFQLDPLIVNSIINLIPESASEWLGIIRLIVWIFTIAWTGGLALWLSIVVGGFIYVILD